MCVRAAQPLKRRSVNKSNRKISRSWAYVFIWMGFISALSSIPGEELPTVDLPYIDKIVHFLEFFILGALMVRAFFSPKAENSSRYIVTRVILSVAIAALYAVIDETHQHFISDRTADLFDFLADFIGSTLGVIIYNMGRKWQI